MNTVSVRSLPVDLGDGPFAVRTEALVKRFGPVAALDGVAVRVPEHAVYVLVGPNGAGKSTLLRTLIDVVCRDAGDVDVLGLDPAVRGAEIRARVGYVSESHTLGYSWMTVGRLMRQHAVYYSSWDAPYAARLAKAYEVDATKKCGSLSKGQSRRVQLLLALAHRPPLLLLDEPTDGLDHVIRDETLALLSEHLADSPTTVLISTHRVHEVERLVDHVGVLRGGRLVGQLPREALLRQLRRYWVDVPDGWSATPALSGRVVRRVDGGRDIELTVWGEEERVIQEFAQAGASVRDVASLSIDDAATALLSRRTGS